MAQWKQLYSSSPEVIEQVKHFYNNGFPIEVRHYLAEWLEEKLLVQEPKQSYDPLYLGEVGKFMTDFLDKINQVADKITEPDSITVKYRLIESAVVFRRNYFFYPSQLYEMVKGCLLAEKQILNSQNINDQIEIRRNAEIVQISNTIDELLIQVRSNDCLSLSLLTKYEELFCCYDDSSEFKKRLKINQENLSSSKQDLLIREKKLSKCLCDVLKSRSQLIETVSKTIDLTKTTEMDIIQGFLNPWVNEQSKLDLLPQFENNILDTMQKWVESLAQILWKTRDQVKSIVKYHAKLKNIKVCDNFDEVSVKIDDLLQMLLKNSFIIEKQPPKIVKTDQKITPTMICRFLIGNSLNFNMMKPTVKVMLLSEAQVNQLRKGKPVGENMGKFINNCAKMEYNETTKQLTANFRTIKLKKAQHAEKKGNQENVTDEKYAMLFYSDFMIGDFKSSVWALSHAVVVICHASQKPHATATVLWHDAFVDSVGSAFHTPDLVPWNRLGTALSNAFKIFTGRGLTNENLHCIAEKLFRKLLPSPIDDSLMVSWSQFCKDRSPERSITFWEWIYGYMDLIRNHLSGPWIDGSIVGFTHKHSVEQILKSCPKGTFILRFSDSVSAGWRVDDHNTSVLHVEPFTAKICTEKSLSNRIMELNHLVLLHPSTPKALAFSKYVTKFQPKKSEYVPIINPTMLEGFTFFEPTQGIMDFEPCSPTSTSEMTYISSPCSELSEIDIEELVCGSQLNLESYLCDEIVDADFIL